MPVFSGRDFPYRWVAWAQLALATAGVSLATLGSLVAPLLAFGLALELLGALLFVANSILLFTRGKSRGGSPIRPPIPNLQQVDRVGTTATKIAGMSLPTALALLLAARLSALGGEWWLAAEHLAALGWIMLMIVGVGYHVLPRFSGRGVRGVRWARAQLACHLAAVVLMVPALGLGLPRVFAAGGVLMVLAMSLFAYTVWPTLQAIRARPGTIGLEARV
jgi:hypothetical protein